MGMATKMLVWHELHRSAAPTSATTTMGVARTSAAGINMNGQCASVQRDTFSTLTVKRAYRLMSHVESPLKWNPTTSHGWPKWISGTISNQRLSTFENMFKYLKK